jgi:membrane protease YdiL (CAAX protease family)
VKRFLQSGIGAAVLWVIASLGMAAAISPWLYQAGKSLAAQAAAHELAAIWEWLGASCGRAKFGRFFDRSLLLSALVLLPLLLRRIRILHRADAVPLEARAHHCWRTAVVQALAGCLIAGGLLWGMGMLLELAGAYVPKAVAHAPGKLWSKILMPALAAAVVEEWLFRGVLLGLWLRFTRPLAAAFGTSLWFAILHFLKPPSGTVIADPAHPLAGFDLLGKILLHFADPRFFVTDFATLTLVGMILALARLRTGALWFSIGLHAGWIAAFKAFNMWYKSVPGHPLQPWGVGESLRSGLLPLATLAVTALVCHFALRYFSTPLSRASR